MSNIHKFYPKNAANDPDNVLEQAIGQFESVLLIGYDKDGILDARASLNLNHSSINWMIDVFKTKLLNGDYNELSE